MYSAGRSTGLVIYPKPVGIKGEKTITAPVVWPQHIQTWPRSGGIDDQDFLEYRIFSAFLRGDQKGTQRRMNRIGHGG